MAYSRPSWLNQPLFAPLRARLHGFSSLPPSIGELNRCAHDLALQTARGQPVRFVVPGNSRLAYEERIWWLGEVETRPDNWHDAMNALIWLTYPRLKAAINQSHHAAIAAQQPQTQQPRGRGPWRDALTQFDECGAIVVSSELDLWQGICAHRWQEVFWQQRNRVMEKLRVFVVGHASLDLLRAPHIGLCSKALFLHVDASWLDQPLEQQLADVDQHLCQRFAAHTALSLTPRSFKPLPLLGLPGVTAASERPEYYQDRRQFRPLRVVHP